ncbi:type II toxin-antitoxin system RelE/ParE family toxin [Pseudaminobacter sp. 19-2017]|uniref:Type II toxin-antitoxin system RelE/ParE family toxin n=1 Tax=Pseudaminobacter soli (ex Zhang et al. 2022) TaxID=2831468 RepID=A0A942DWC2_9HYPH|nr:type II toxin-antitoxin system RelE/ParE family toxin [Pseudaminobacter soli]MBS3648256.1 type II toxin-antitoxin system RelE/ParE family toxin [Pseudaminobacter soli]
MTYRLEFLPSARKEWDKLGATVRQQLVKKLRGRLEQPRIAAAALQGMPDHYKIKLRQSGYRLVYRVSDRTVTVTVVTFGRRDHGKVYDVARRR